MKKLISSVLDYFIEWVSNKGNVLHFFLGVIGGMFFGVIPCLLVFIALEFKDYLWRKNNQKRFVDRTYSASCNKFYWSDVLSGLVGAIITAGYIKFISWDYFSFLFGFFVF